MIAISGFYWNLLEIMHISYAIASQHVNVDDAARVVACLRTHGNSRFGIGKGRAGRVGGVPFALAQTTEDEGDNDDHEDSDCRSPDGHALYEDRQAVFSSFLLNTHIILYRINLIFQSWNGTDIRNISNSVRLI